MDHATADYLMFLDSDDLFFEDACEFLHDEITTEDIGKYLIGCYHFDTIQEIQSVLNSIIHIIQTKFLYKT